MVIFKAFNPNVEVIGQSVLTVVDGMIDKDFAVKILEAHGIFKVKPENWYPQQNWLDAFREISDKIGPLALFSIGKRIPDNAAWPPQINSIENALPSIDIAYHMNHRINDVVMFNFATGEKTEGIGHYTAKKTGEREMQVICENPYPCQFDKGIISAVAEKFKPAGSKVTVFEDESKGCRLRGAQNCQYTVCWSW